MSKLDVQAKGNFIIAVPFIEENDKPFEVVDNSQPNSYLTVLSVGENITLFKKGDKVIPSINEFPAFIRNGTQYLVLNEDQLVGVVK